MDVTIADLGRVENPARGPFRRRNVVAIVACVAILAGCQMRLTESDRNGVGAQNGTGVTLHFREFVDGQWYDLGSVSSGNMTQIVGYPDLTSESSAIARDRCTIGFVVALDPKGNEVARHEPGLCVNDVWVINAGGSPSPSRSR